ncbi:apoptosis-associated speck-like protein containing a CARD [Lissotriton helveticus]
MSGYFSQVKTDQRGSTEQAREVIFFCLEELTGKQFKEFKIHLQDCAVKRGQLKIPRSRLENANCMDTVNTMIEYYDDRMALKITKNVLERIPRLDLMEKVLCSVQRYFGKKHKLSEAEIEDDNGLKLGENPKSAETFIKRHRLNLIERMGNIKSIMEILRYKDILQEEEIEEVLADKTSSSQNLRLILMVVLKGPESMDEFLLALQKKNPALYNDLEPSHCMEARKE